MKILLLFISTAIFIRCGSQGQHFISSPDLIRELVNKYPQLGVDYFNKPISFTLKRQIKDENWEIDVELYCAGQPEKRVIVLRKDVQAYAIPLFDDDQMDYWQMDGANRYQVKRKLNITFLQELKNANKRLGISRFDLYFCQYIFQHLLLLNEEFHPDPCPEAVQMPYQLKYKGSDIFILSVFSRDSLSLQKQGIFYNCIY